MFPRLDVITFNSSLLLVLGRSVKLECWTSTNKRQSVLRNHVPNLWGSVECRIGAQFTPMGASTNTGLGNAMRYCENELRFMSGTAICAQKNQLMNKLMANVADRYP